MTYCSSKSLRQFAPISSFTSKFLFIFISGIILCKYFHCWMFSGVPISSDTTGRSSWENILGRVIQSACFPSTFATSKSSTTSDECFQSPFKVLTVILCFYLLPSILKQGFLYKTSLTTVIKHSPGSNLCVQYFRSNINWNHAHAWLDSSLLMHILIRYYRLYLLLSSWFLFLISLCDFSIIENHAILFNFSIATSAFPSFCASLGIVAITYQLTATIT